MLGNDIKKGIKISFEFTNKEEFEDLLVKSRELVSLLESESIDKLDKTIEKANRLVILLTKAKEIVDSLAD